MPLPKGTRFRVKTTKTGKKIRLAFAKGTSSVIEAKRIGGGGDNMAGRLTDEDVRRSRIAKRKIRGTTGRLTDEDVRRSRRLAKKKVLKGVLKGLAGTSTSALIKRAGKAGARVAKSLGKKEDVLRLRLKRIPKKKFNKERRLRILLLGKKKNK